MFSQFDILMECSQLYYPDVWGAIAYSLELTRLQTNADIRDNYKLDGPKRSKKSKAKQKRYREDPAYRAKELSRYKTDPVYRAKQVMAQRIRDAKKRKQRT